MVKLFIELSVHVKTEEMTSWMSRSGSVQNVVMSYEYLFDTVGDDLSSLKSIN